MFSFLFFLSFSFLALVASVGFEREGLGHSVCPCHCIWCIGLSSPRDTWKLQVEKSSEKKVKSRRCYLCHEKGHLASSCTSGNPLSLYPSFCAAVPPKGAVVPLNPAVAPLFPTVLPPQGSCFVAPFLCFFCLSGSTARGAVVPLVCGLST